MMVRPIVQELCAYQCANEDVRITAHHTANRGLSAARNEGIKHATGEYITFVDSDDYIGLSHIANLLRLLKYIQKQIL